MSNEIAVVITGFDKFGDYPTNPTKEVAEALRGQRILRYNLRPLVFPATIPDPGVNRGRQLLSFAREIGAVGIISLGLASDAKGLQAVDVGVNIRSGKYCPKELVGTKIDDGRPGGERLVLDLGPWNLGKLEENCRSLRIPFDKVSHDPGGFCCNDLIYTVLCAQIAQSDRARIPFLFLHVPCSLESVAEANREEFAKSGKITMTVAQIILGLVRLLINATL